MDLENSMNREHLIRQRTSGVEDIVEELRSSYLKKSYEGISEYKGDMELVLKVVPDRLLKLEQAIINYQNENHLIAKDASLEIDVDISWNLLMLRLPIETIAKMIVDKNIHRYDKIAPVQPSGNDVDITKSRYLPDEMVREAQKVTRTRDVKDLGYATGLIGERGYVDELLIDGYKARYEDGKLILTVPTSGYQAKMVETKDGFKVIVDKPKGFVSQVISEVAVDIPDKYRSIIERDLGMFRTMSTEAQYKSPKNLS
ncbi:MAG: hypothetical protein KJ601_06780 [Nanoarchaeota archaeon]|nr:hypothetical protein [Nanoarchaeota archaeon]